MITPSLEIIEVVADGLKELLPDVAFVGGISTILYIDSAAALTPRPTDDVDCVIELHSSFHQAQLEEKLRALGFRHHRKGPLCRWEFGSLLVDIMPTDEKILGFSNSWYAEGMRAREMRKLPRGAEIFVFSLPYFVASKLEAYKSRGNRDPRTSHDMEDIVFVLDGNSDPLSHIEKGGLKVKEYLSREVRKLLKNAVFHEALDCQLGKEGTKRLERLEQIFLSIGELRQKKI